MKTSMFQIQIVHQVWVEIIMSLLNCSIAVMYNSQSILQSWWSYLRLGNSQKCRAKFGMEQQPMWCDGCRSVDKVIMLCGLWTMVFVLFRKKKRCLRASEIGNSSFNNSIKLENSWSSHSLHSFNTLHSCFNFESSQYHTSQLYYN